MAQPSMYCKGIFDKDVEKKRSKEIHSQQYSKKTKNGYAFWVWRQPERTMIKNDYMENHEEIKEESLAGNR